jgi:hypothetical protein
MRETCRAELLWLCRAPNLSFASSAVGADSISSAAVSSQPSLLAWLMPFNTDDSEESKTWETEWLKDDKVRTMNRLPHI